MRSKDSYKKTFWHSFVAGMGFAFARAMRKLFAAMIIPVLFLIFVSCVAVFNYISSLFV